MAVFDFAAHRSPDAPARRRWTVEEYVRLDEIGLLGGEGKHFELLDGEIVEKLGQSYSHITGVDLAAEALRRVFGSGHLIRQQSPIRMPDSDAPEPDVAVIRGAPRDFESRAPRPDEIALLVEVAYTRLDTALGPKVEIYSRHGIAEYWILDVRNRALQVRRGPRPESADWTETRIYSESESVAPLGAPDSFVAVVDLLPTIGSEAFTP